MMRRRDATAKTPPARRAASSRENGKREVSITGVLAIKIIARGIAHIANFNHDLNISRDTNVRTTAIGKKKRAKL